ncbi:MAG: PAS domain S-box protein [Bryobacterales bacterium]|nr:PAS domain S-box protein [Bryobacterales bacterium]
MTPTRGSSLPLEDEIAVLKARVSSLEAELAALRAQAAESDALHPAAAQLLDSVSDAFFALDSDFRYLWLNRAAERMIGIKREDLTGRLTWDIFPDSRNGPFHTACAQALQTQLPAEFESYYQTWGRWYTNRVYPSPNGLLLYIRDITEERRNSTQAELQAHMLAATPDAVIAVDADYRVTFWNGGAERMYGIPAAEILGKPLSYSHTYLWLNAEDERQSAEDLRTIGSWTGENVHFRRAGAPLSVSSTVNTIPERLGGGMFAIIRDLTQRRTMEREASEKGELIRAITSVAPVLLYVYDLQTGRNIWINEALSHILGYSVAELHQMGPSLLGTLLHPEDGAQYPAHFARLRMLAEGETAEFEYRMRHRDGGWVWLLSYERAFRRDERGVVVQIVGSAQDITLRREIENENARNMRLLRTIVESTSDLIWVKDTAGRITFANQPVFDMLGNGQPERVIGRLPGDLTTDAAQAHAVEANDARVMRTAQPEVVETEFGPPHNRRIFLSTKTPVRDPAGAVVGLVGVSRDITEQKHAERHLRDTAARQQFLLCLSDALRPLSDPAEIQSTAARILGEQLQANRVLFSEIDGEDVVVEGDYTNGLPSTAGRFRVADFGDGLALAHRRGEMVNYADIPNDASLPQPVRDAFAAVGTAANLSVGLLKEGRWVAALTAQQAVPRAWTTLEASLLRETAERTWEAVQRARAERALRNSQRTLASFFETTPLLMGLVELDGDLIRTISVNAAAAQFLHRAPASIDGKTAAELGTQPDFNQVLLDGYRRAQALNAPVTFDYAHHQGSGLRWLRVIAAFVGPGTRGKPRFSFVAEDITARKLSEERELAAIAKFKTVFHQSGIFAAILDLDGRMLEVNDLAVVGCGYSRDQAIGRLFWDTPWWEKSPHSREQLRWAVQQGAAGRTTRDVLSFHVADGTERWTEFSLHPVRDESGTIVFLTPTGIDITDRVKAERALALSEERLSLAKLAAGLGIHDFRPITGEIDWDQRTRELWGLTPDEPVTFQIFAGAIHPDDWPHTEAAIARAMDPAGDGRYYAVYRVIHRIDRQTRWVEVTGRSAFSDGRCVRLVGTVLDITARKRAEEQFLLAAERAAVAQRAASAILFEFHPQTGVVFRDPMVEELLGYRNTEIGATAGGWRDLIHPDDCPRFDAALANTLRDAVDLSLEYRVRHKSGHWLWVSDQARPACNEKGEVERLVGLVSDITRRRQIQLALEESEARFRTMADACPTIIWVTSATGENEFINQAYRSFCGIGDDRILHFEWQNLLHPADAPAYIDAFQQAIHNQTAFYARCRMRGADGQWRWMASTAAPRFSADGTFLGHVGSSPDVHDLITAQQALEESEERFRTLADNMSQFAWMADGEGSLFWYNRRWYDFTGTTLAEMHGWGWQSVHHPDHLDRVVTHFRRCLASGEPWEDTFPLRGKDGQYRWFLSRALPIRDASGRIYRWFGTNTDITCQLDVERELRRANEDLEQFAYSASHDLQEPLRSVAVYSQLLEREYGPQLDERATLFLQQVGNGARRMGRLVSDLLAYSRTTELEAAPVERVDSARILEQVRLSLAQSIAESGAELHADPLPVVLIRPVHLELLLQNLIGNALKYRTDGASPRIDVRAELKPGAWEFAVRDNGIGIEPEYHAKIFGVFKRLHHNEQKYPGTGIGLAICQRIVESYGGRIWVESQLGKGSTFRFTLPEPGTSS